MLDLVKLTISINRHTVWTEARLGSLSFMIHGSEKVNRVMNSGAWGSSPGPTRCTLDLGQVTLPVYISCVSEDIVMLSLQRSQRISWDRWFMSSAWGNAWRRKCTLYTGWSAFCWLVRFGSIFWAAISRSWAFTQKSTSICMCLWTGKGPGHQALKLCFAVVSGMWWASGSLFKIPWPGVPTAPSCPHGLSTQDFCLARGFALGRAVFFLPFLEQDTAFISWFQIRLLFLRGHW